MYTTQTPFGKPVFGVKFENFHTIQPIDSPEKDFNFDSPTASEALPSTRHFSSHSDHQISQVLLLASIFHRFSNLCETTAAEYMTLQNFQKLLGFIQVKSNVDP
jgi:hypothetical protein